MTSEGNNATAKFQIADLTHALCSVSKMCDQGNAVVFGPKGGYSQNTAAGKKTWFRRENNV